MRMFPGEVKLGGARPSCFSSPTVTSCPFCCLLSALFFLFLCFLLGMSLLKIAPRHSAEVPPGVPKHKKAVTCLTEENTHVRPA